MHVEYRGTGFQASFFEFEDGESDGIVIWTGNCDVLVNDGGIGEDDIRHGHGRHHRTDHFEALGRE